jgi:hypothetical protein
MSGLFNGRSHMVVGGLLALVVAVVVTGCTLPGGSSNGSVNPLATPLPAQDVGEDAKKGATEDYQNTWDNYLQDAIAEQVLDRQQKIDFLQRYENPNITNQNLKGLVQDVDLVTDRTTFNLTHGDTVASAITDFDVRLTFANGDSDTRTCKQPVEIDKDPDSGKWYILNPGQLQIFAVCNP